MKIPRSTPNTVQISNVNLPSDRNDEDVTDGSLVFAIYTYLI